VRPYSTNCYSNASYPRHATPHETSPPCSIVIAISSRNKAPLNRFATCMHRPASHGDHTMGSSEFFAYYFSFMTKTGWYYRVDEIVRPDETAFWITLSSAQLRSHQCVSTDDDSVEIPQCDCFHLLKILGNGWDKWVFCVHYVIISLYACVTDVIRSFCRLVERSPTYWQWHYGDQAFVRELTVQSWYPYGKQSRFGMIRLRLGDVV